MLCIKIWNTLQNLKLGREIFLRKKSQSYAHFVIALKKMYYFISAMSTGPVQAGGLITLGKLSNTL